MQRYVSPTNTVFVSPDERRRVAYEVLARAIKKDENEPLRAFAHTGNRLEQTEDALSDILSQHSGDGQRLGAAVGVLFQGKRDQTRVDRVLLQAAKAGNERAVSACMRQGPSPTAIWDAFAAAAVHEHVGAAVMIAGKLGRMNAGQTLLDLLSEHNFGDMELSRAAGTLRNAGLIR